MAPPEPAMDLRTDETLEILRSLLGNLKTPELAEKVLRSVEGLSKLESEHGSATHSYLRALHCLPALQELDNMDIADMIKQKTAQSMVTGFTSVQLFFGMLPTPERHNACKNYHELAGLYITPAKILAARYGLVHDPFKSSDPDAPMILETVVKAVKKMRTPSLLTTIIEEDEGVADLKAGLTRLALGHTPKEMASQADLHKQKFLNYLRWVAQGRKDSSSPLAAKSTTKDTAVSSSSDGNLSMLSGGCLSGICASCGSQDAAHKCKLCLITLDNHNREHIVAATNYCNESCRNSHFEAHKTTCKEIRKLDRSSALFMEAFHQYLQVANWKIPVAAITLENGIVTKHYVPTLSTTESLRHLTDSQWQADAAMSSFACGDILYWAKPIFEFFIKPCCASVELVNYCVKNANTAVANAVVSMDSRSSSLHHVRYNILRPHTVTRLTLPSGMQYAFDPTAAQFGWKEYLAPWDEYARRRIHRIDEIVPLEKVNDTQVPVMESELRSGADPDVDRAKDVAAVELVKVLRARKGGLRAVLKLSDGQFEEAKKDSAKTMEDSVRELIKSLK